MQIGERQQYVFEDIQTLRQLQENIQGIQKRLSDAYENELGISFGQNKDKKNDRDLLKKTGINCFY